VFVYIISGIAAYFAVSCFASYLIMRSSDGQSCADDWHLGLIWPVILPVAALMACAEAGHRHRLRKNNTTTSY
jgi:hypothetical protein